MKKKILFIFIFVSIFFMNVSASSKYQQYQSGDIIYFNPITNLRCTDYNIKNSDDLVKEGCMKWYVLKDFEELETIDIILDHNTSNNVSWSTLVDSNNIRSNINGPKEVLEQLKLDTINWNNQILQNQKRTYKTNHSKNEYLVDYSNNKARLLSADEVAEITSSTWSSITATVTIENESAGGNRRFFLDTKLTTELPKTYNYGWLYDRTSLTCKDTGCLNNATKVEDKTSGFWTDTALNTNQELAFGIDSQGSLYALGTNSNEYFGIRPVITIKKEEKKEIVQVGDTNKTSYFGLCIGIMVLLLGQLVIYQAFRKDH